jgi:hypothetical protein
MERQEKNRENKQAGFPRPVGKLIIRLLQARLLLARRFVYAAIWIAVTAILHTVAGLGCTEQRTGNRTDRSTRECTAAIAADCATGESAQSRAANTVTGRALFIRRACSR